MRNRIVKLTNNNRPENPEEFFESLFRSVPARPRPPDGVEEIVFKQFSAEWEALHANKTPKKRVVYWALAASLLLAVLIQPLVFQLSERSGVTVAAGTVEKHRGDVAVILDQDRIALKPGDPPFELFPQQSLLTGKDSGLSIRWGDHKIVRVDENTRVNLLSTNEIELIAGQIYVDVPPQATPADPDEKLVIVTRLGTIWHTGTQFMVSADDAVVEVRVREGIVTIDSGNGLLVSHQGEQTVVDASGKLQTGITATYGKNWQWAEKLTPVFELEGSTLEDFLLWVHRETGKQVEFESVDARNTASSTILHGSVDLEPMLSLDLVLQTTELLWSEKDGTLHIAVNP